MAQTITCPKCAYARGANDHAPAWQCPKCGIAYSKYNRFDAEVIKATKEKLRNKAQDRKLEDVKVDVFFGLLGAAFGKVARFFKRDKPKANPLSPNKDLAAALRLKQQDDARRQRAGVLRDPPKPVSIGIFSGRTIDANTDALHPVAAVMNSEWYQLNKQATAFKKSGQMDEAIAALYRVKEIKGVDYDDDKLAKYLQAAGRYDEAIEVIEQMLEDAIPAYAKNLNHQPKSVEDAGRIRYCMRLCGSALLICKREKRPDVAHRFEQLGDQYRELWEWLEPIAAAELKQKNNDWKKTQVLKSSRERFDAMAAFHQKYQRRA